MSGPKPTSTPNQFIIPTFRIPGGGDIHDTIKIDRYGNLYDEHTTVRIPGDKIKDIHIDWDK